MQYTTVIWSLIHTSVSHFINPFYCSLSIPLSTPFHSMKHANVNRRFITAVAPF